MFNQISATPSGHALWEAVAAGGAVSCAGVDAAGWAHLAAELRARTGRTVVLVVAKLKFQETLQQDLETWLRLMEVEAPARFYPDWEVLPHEMAKLEEPIFLEGTPICKVSPLWQYCTLTDSRVAQT